MDSIFSLISEQPSKRPNKPFVAATIILLVVILSTIFLFEAFPEELHNLFPGGTPLPTAIPQVVSEPPNSLSKFNLAVNQVFSDASSSNSDNAAVIQYTKLAKASETLEDEYANYLKAYQGMLSVYQRTKDPEVKYTIIQLKNYLYYSPAYKEGDIIVPQ